MRRMALVLTGVSVVLALCAPPLRAEDQQRSRKSRNSGAAHVQATPAAGSSAPAVARRAVPRRAPAVRTGTQDRNQQAPTIRRSTAGRTSAQTSGARRRVQAAPQRDQQAPTIRRSTPGRTSAQTSGARRRVQAAPQTTQPAVRQRRPDSANQGRTTRRAVPRVRSGSETRPAGRAGGRDGRVDGRRTPSRTSRPGQTQPRVVSRRPSDRLITRAVPRVRSPLVSRPLIIQGGRARSVLAYRGGYVRPRGLGVHIHLPGYVAPRIFGTAFYFGGYNRLSVGFGLGYPSYYSYAYPYGYSSYSYPRYGSGYGATYGYGPTGTLRLRVGPRHAQVFVDGYFVGRVDDFDGVFQSLRLEEGPHQIEILADGYEPLVFNVWILLGEKITYDGELLPLL